MTKITTLDTNWMGRPHSVAAALLESNGHRGIIDPGPASTGGALVRENPRLEVYVHAYGAPHLIDPSKLLASAGRLWGDELKRLFGETEPVPRQNLRILEGGEKLKLGERSVEVKYTPGHASHHVSYFAEAEGIAFIGDTGGVRIENGPYI